MTLILSRHKSPLYEFIRQAEVTPYYIELEYFIQHKDQKELIRHFTISIEEFREIEKALKEGGK